MADIWLATDSNNKAFALRRMLETYKWNFFAKRRFIRGCEILATLSDNENIIGYVEHGEIKGAAVFAHGICRGREPERPLQPARSHPD